jgi:hypothetical protein
MSEGVLKWAEMSGDLLTVVENKWEVMKSECRGWRMRRGCEE